jgi:asparagine synthetase B (glutamine-hydrolysing)
MIQTKFSSQNFSIWGYTEEPEKWLQHRLPNRLGIRPVEVKINQSSSSFYYSNYGDIYQDERAVVIKLGFLRTPDQALIRARNLLTDDLIGDHYVRNDRIVGNGLSIYISKTEPNQTSHKTILAVPQVYFFQSQNDLICSDRLSVLADLIDDIQLDVDIIPLHFLFRSIPADRTYYQQIRRMLPGHVMYWNGRQIKTRIVEPLNAGRYENDQQAKEQVYQSLHNVVKTCVSQVSSQQESIGTLLSGGVDSTLIQYLLNIEQPSQKLNSYSYAIRSPGFQLEIDYAAHASQLMNTNHSFIEFGAEDIAGLIVRSIDILGQPPILETEPGMLSIAEYSQRNHSPNRFFMSGQGADTLFGLTYSLKLKGIRMLSWIPGMPWILKGISRVVSPWKRVSQLLEKGGEILLSSKNPHSFFAPTNSIAVYGDLQIARRCFGDEVITKAFEARRDFAATFLQSNHYLEGFHTIDLFTDTYELGVQRQQIFLAHQREQIHPFFDDEVIRTAYAISPDFRYINGLRPKHLLKDILTQKTHSPISKRPKGFSVFENDIFEWMRSGSLKQLVADIQLPGFLSKKDFEDQLRTPGYFLWILLNFDLFRRSCENRRLR